MTIDAKNQIPSAENVDRTIIACRNGSPVRVSDVGRAIDSVQNTKIAAWYDNRRAVIVDAQLQPGASAVDLVEGERAALPGLRQRLPPSIEVTTAGGSTVVVRAAVMPVGRLVQEAEPATLYGRPRAWSPA